MNRPSSRIGSAVGAQPPALPQVADHVPVDGRLVHAAGLGIRAPDREVHGAADLLVEQDRPDRAVDAEVRADPDLAQPRRASVGGERLAQVVLAAVGRAATTRPARNSSSIPSTATPRGLDGIV